MLERVGLAGAGKRRVGNYSLGMRQRLGIASALIGDPAVLVLDEPANGMDPEGIRWMRELLRDFAARGGTVLLSSHLLGEVQATVDRLVVIGSGRIVADGSLDELLAGGRTVVRGLDTDALAGALRAAGHRVRTEGGALTVDATAEQVGRLRRRAGQVLLELRDGGAAGLEDLFFSLTSSAARHAGASRMTRRRIHLDRTVHRTEARRTVMSTALTSSHATPPTPTTAATAIRPQRLSTVFLVELRKLTDTRSGKAIVGIGVAIPLIALTWLLIKGTGSDQSWRAYSPFMPVLSLTIPLIGLFAMTSEWTQRTALTTFTLSPRRGRVLAMKFLARSRCRWSSRPWWWV